MKAIIAFTDAGIIEDSTLLFKEESYKEFEISNKLGVASAQDSISVITETTEETEMVPEINIGIAAAFDQKTIIGG